MKIHTAPSSTQRQRSSFLVRTGRKRFVGLLLLLALAVLMAGCKVEILSGPSVVADGETVVYTLKLSDGSSSGDPLWVVADVPLGWSFVSAFFEGTAQGQPVSGMGQVSGFSPCVGDLQPGYHRVRIETPPITTNNNDMGTAELTFDVGSQPAGAYPVLFYFASTSVNGSDCSPPAARTINANGTAPVRFAETIADGRGTAPALAGALDLAVTADGSRLLVTSSFDDALTVLRRNTRGRLVFEADFVDGVGGVDGIAQPQALALSPDGAHAYVGGLDDDAIAVFGSDPADGTFSFSSVVFDGGGAPPALDGVTGLAVSPDGGNLYAVANQADALNVFQRDPASGSLTAIQTLEESTDPGALSGVSEVVASPDGEQVYVLSRAENEVTIYDRTPATGMLIFAARVSAAILPTPVLLDFLVMAPDGAQLYALGRNEIVHFGREADGTLTHIATQPKGMAASGPFSSRGNAAVAPSGEFFYTLDTSAVAVYARDTATGALTFASEHFQDDGEPLIEGLASPTRLAVAPDGRNLYTTSNSTVEGDTVAVFDLRVLFADGFETGDTTRWSSSVP